MESANSTIVTNKEEITDKLKQNSIEWIQQDEKEKEAKATLKEIAIRKKELNDVIMQGLDQINLPHLDLRSGGKLKFCTTTTFAPLKKEDIFNTIKTELNDETRARMIMDKLYDREGREAKKVTTLKKLKR